MKALVNTSIERKFVAIMLLTLLAVNGSLLAAFSFVSRNALEQEIRAKKDAVLEANSRALSEPLWNYDFANLQKVAATIALDPDIARVTITNDQDETVAEAASADNAAAHRSPEIDVRQVEITHRVDNETVPVGTLRISYLRERIDAAVRSEQERWITLFIASAIAALLSAVIANRLMIVRPLSRLTFAIEATKDLGKRHRVEWQSSDEIGQVASNFNDMQGRLEIEAEHLRHAHKRLSNFYNNAPVMLYSVDANDTIVDVSDYWLSATGYSATQVMGRRFAEFLTDDGLRDYYARPRLSSLAAGERATAYCKFRKKDGCIIDVLISEKPDLDHDDGVQRSLSVMTNITDLKVAEQKIRRQAHTDALTGLANRTAFSAGAEAAVVRAEAKDTQIGILYFDIDRFKWLNDSLGHHAGDDVLKTAAARIRPLLGETDLFSRLGGDEFAVLLEGEDIGPRATALAELIGKSLSTSVEIGGRTVNVTASIGIAFYPGDADTADDLLKAADVAMYTQKRMGRDGYCLFDDQMGRAAARQIEVERHIIDGLTNDWFELHLQPVVDLRTMKTLGFEGFARLNHPEEGHILPEEIIGVAEENGLIQDFGEHILDMGARGIDALQEIPELENTSLSLNLSGAQFLPGLPAKLASILMNHKVRPDRLILEITESVLMQNRPELQEIFNNISRLGCRFALDDFGKGYSSLSYLSNFPVDIVKIDRDFVQSLTGDCDPWERDKARALIRGITILARDMNLMIVAEGIETEAQCDMLKNMGIKLGQGYLFGRPQPVETYLADNHVAISERG